MISFGTSGAKARNFGRGLIAALEALRHPKALGLEEMISFGTPGAKARNFRRGLIAALEALRHPKAV